MNERILPLRLHKLWLLVVVSTVFALSACSGLPQSNLRRVQLASVRVVAAADANASSATSLDLVFVYDESVLPLIPVDAGTWFTNKASLIQGLGTGVDVTALQLPPVSVVDPVKLPPRHARAVAVYAFAGYLAPSGQTRMNLGNYRHATIRLAASTADVSGP